MNPLVTSLLVFVGVTVFVYIMYGRTAVLLAMKPENRLDRLSDRIRALIRFGLGQKRMVDPEERAPGNPEASPWANGGFRPIARRL